LPHTAIQSDLYTICNTWTGIIVYKRLRTNNTLHDFIKDVSKHTWHLASENRLHLDIADTASSCHKENLGGKGEKVVG